MFGGLYQDIKKGTSALDIMNNALGRVLDRLADNSINSLVDGIFGKSGGSGALSSLFGGSGGISESVKGLNLASLFGASPLPTFASGVSALGIIDGPGTGTSDSIVARVFKGESIVKASATARHRPLIEAMNADRLPAFARGGTISAAVNMMSAQATDSARMASGQASAAGAGSAPSVKFIVNEAPGGDKVGEQTTRLGQDGSLEIIADMIDSRMAQKVGRNRGALANAIHTRQNLKGV